MHFNSNNKWLSPALLLFVSMLALWACVKTNFDEPPIGGVQVDIQANTTIKQLKALHLSQGGFDHIDGDLIISGEVTMDDRSGNYYKTLVIQDATGGIEVKFNDGYLYTTMPIGRTIYIRCKDLLLTDYNGLTQLVGSIKTENGVQSAVGLTAGQARQKVVKGAYAATPLAPKVVTIAEATSNVDLISTLIKIQDVQFTQCDAGKTYADPVTQNSLNRTLQDCNGAEILLRSSGYADFAAQRTPTLHGEITGILSIYGADYQMYIRNTADLNITGPRCGSSGSSNATQMDISAVRAVFTGTTTTAPANRKIHGIVISDKFGKNLNSRNVYVQDGTAGILVRFQADHCFELGDEIEVDISGQELSEFHKLLQVNNVPLNNATIIASGKATTATERTIADVNTNYNTWESTLVTLRNVTIGGGGTLSGSHTLTDDAGNSIVLFTSSAASFATVPTPAAKVTITAIISDYDGKQVLLRNSSDIQQ